MFDFLEVIVIFFYAKNYLKSLSYQSLVQVINVNEPFNVFYTYVREKDVKKGVKCPFKSHNTNTLQQYD